ncbi:MAG: DUF6152 family protein [Steroidobacteraceae bacterium]
MNNSRWISVVLLSGIGWLSNAGAHHSAAAFDRSNPVAMTGTVKKFLWTNPHAWVHLMVPDGKGGEDEYVLEGPAPVGLARNGWTGRTLQAGMKIRCVVAPRRDGTHGGEFLAVFKDGKQIKF